MNASDDSVLREKTRLDNRYRFAVSLTAFSAAYLLSALGWLPSIRPLVIIFLLFSVPYGLSWLWLARGTRLNVLRYVLSLSDFMAITATVAFTGGPGSPFFYLYPIPFLVHALHFDLRMILWDGTLSLIFYSGLLWRFHTGGERTLELGLGQLLFLGVMIAAATFTAKRFSQHNAAVTRSVRTLRTTVGFLEALNAIPPGLSLEALQTRILQALRDVLKPFQVHPRLWIVNMAWKTLHGIGEHPAMRPGAPRHLPTQACPAFATRRAFGYSQNEGDPCASEQFNYFKHLCLPVANEQDCLGVLFLGSYVPGTWDPEERHLFEMLAQSIALTIQRKHLFETLQEKISELNVSFEVGAASLATFGGSTHSLDETTVHILDSVLSILKVDRASLMLWDPESTSLQTQWVRGGDFTIQSPLRLAWGEGMAGWALKTGEPYWAEYAMGDPHYRASAQPIRSLLCVPVYAMDRQPLGVINAVTLHEPRVFLPREITFLINFCRQAALAIENARLHHTSRANIDQLKEISQLKSQFLSLVSHDLRGPLTGIRGFCEVLKQESRGSLSAAQVELIDHLERQVDLQERMVDDLLDLAKMEKGQLSIQPAPTDVGALLQQEVEKSQMEAKERRITLSWLSTLPPSRQTLHIDGGRIRQVLWNLIHNALKFTPEDGRIVVRASAEADAVHIEVEDTGVGLAAEMQDRVFDKFFQVSPGGSTSARGLGLGLAICKEIVVAHHGQIRAYSPGLGLGTTIAFSLPLPQQEAPAKTLAA